MLPPSAATPNGPLPTAKVPSTAPAALSRVTVLLKLLVTQMLLLAKVNAIGRFPTANEPRLLPLVALSLVTVLLLRFATHTLVPSKARPPGPVPTVYVPRIAPVSLL